MTSPAPFTLNIERGIVGILFGSVLAHLLLLGGMAVTAMRHGINEIALGEWLYPWLGAVPLFAAAGWYSFATGHKSYGSSIIVIFLMTLAMWAVWIFVIPTPRGMRGDTTLIYAEEVARLIVPPFLSGLILTLITLKCATGVNDKRVLTDPDESGS